MLPFASPMMRTPLGPSPLQNAPTPATTPASISNKAPKVSVDPNYQRLMKAVSSDAEMMAILEPPPVGMQGVKALHMGDSGGAALHFAGFRLDVLGKAYHDPAAAGFTNSAAAAQCALQEENMQQRNELAAMHAKLAEAERQLALKHECD